MAKYTTISEWAKSIGSNAKTRSGQRRAIISNFRKSPGILEMEFPSSELKQQWGGSSFKGAYRLGARNARMSRENYERYRTLSRQKQFAENHPLTLSHPAPATVQDVKGVLLASQVELLSLKPNDCRYAVVGGWTIHVAENVDYDYSYYAKSYGHPKKTVLGRTVFIRRVEKDGTLGKKDIEVDAFRGNYLLDSLINAGITSKHSGLMNVRLHTAYDVELVRSGKTIKIYHRTIAGDHVDYCAVAHGQTFHAFTAKKSVEGLRTKLHVLVSRKNGKIIDWKLCKKLGFCDSGITAFAQTYDLDTSTTYKAEKIADCVKSNPAAAEPFKKELRTLSAAVGFQIAV